MYKYQKPESQIIIFSTATAQHSPNYVIREDTAPNFRDDLFHFLLETSKIIKDARKEMRSRYPSLLAQ